MALEIGLEHEPRDSQKNASSCETLLSLLAQGKTNVEIALEQGKSEADVSRRVRRLLDGLGLRRSHAPLWLRFLQGAEQPQQQFSLYEVSLCSPPSWTMAERQVVFSVAAGFSTKDVARVRARNEFTVRKQMRAAAQKAGVIDRLALFASTPMRSVLRR
ncbi:MAG: hypothetical protein AAF449_16105 [Myxococcota bacterium]